MKSARLLPISAVATCLWLGGPSTAAADDAYGYEFSDEHALKGTKSIWDEEPAPPRGQRSHLFGVLGGTLSHRAARLGWRGTSASEALVGLSVTGRRLEGGLARDAARIVHFDLALHLGGGTKGVTGVGHAEAGVGVKAPWFFDAQGPILRGAVVAHAQGAALGLDQRLGLPRLEAGYQLHTDTFLAEIVASGTFWLAGRQEVWDHASSMKLANRPALGGSTRLATGGLFLEAGFERTYLRAHYGDRLDFYGGRACAAASELALCTTAGLREGDWLGGFRTTAVGLMIGYGEQEFRPRP